MLPPAYWNGTITGATAAGNANVSDLAEGGCGSEGEVNPLAAGCENNIHRLVFTSFRLFGKVNLLQLSYNCDR